MAAVRRKPFDGCYVLTCHFAHGDAAGAYRALTNQHRTGATLLDAATVLGPGRPIVSRIAQSSGVSSSTSTNRFLPLIFNSVISFSYNKVVELILPGKAE